MAVFQLCEIQRGLLMMVWKRGYRLSAVTQLGGQLLQQSSCFSGEVGGAAGRTVIKPIVPLMQNIAAGHNGFVPTAVNTAEGSWRWWDWHKQTLHVEKWASAQATLSI